MLEPDEVWLIAGAGLLVAEVVVPGVFLMWLGLAAIGTGLVVMAFAPEWGWQVVTFAVLALVAIGVALRLRARKRAAEELNTAQSGLVGRPARVLTAEGPVLRVRIGDSDWSARLAPGTAAPEKGAVLKVVDVEGTTVILGA
jgi:membrane protein implicated in regulation of membrane protease activity